MRTLEFNDVLNAEVEYWLGVNLAIVDDAINSLPDRDMWSVPKSRERYKALVEAMARRAGYEDALRWTDTGEVESKCWWGDSDISDISDKSFEELAYRIWNMVEDESLFTTWLVEVTR